jgi:hypothetical protein
LRSRPYLAGGFEWAVRPPDEPALLDPLLDEAPLDDPLLADVELPELPDDRVDDDPVDGVSVV